MTTITSKNTAIISAVALTAGAVLGGVVSKIVLTKAPKLEPVVTWASGALVGIGATILLSPNFVTKSEAGAILASGD